MFTKKHYKAIAEIIKQENVKFENIKSPQDRTQRMTCGFISAALAKYFTEDNPNFDRDKFAAACRIE